MAHLPSFYNIIGQRYEMRDGKVHLVLDIEVNGYPSPLEASMEIPDELVATWKATVRHSTDDGDDTPH